LFEFSAVFMASSLVHNFTKHGLRALARSQPAAAGVGLSHVHLISRACATTSGRRSRRPQKAGLNAAASIKVKLPPSPAEIWGKQSAPPPSLERLNLEDSLRAEVLKIGEDQGPAAAYDVLVRSTSLECDAAQVECSAVLQKMWTGLREHRAEWKDWEAKHQKWQEEYATWTKLKHEHEARIQDAKASHDEGEAGNKQTIEAADIPPEPVEPPAPMPENHGCYLWGNVGRGKSLLMDLFVDCCDKNSDIDLPVMRIHFHEFMQNVHRELHFLRMSGGERTTTVVAKRLAKEVRLIAFDEFQITNIADAMIVETLFDALFTHGVAVLMTTNRPPEDLYKDGLNRHMAIPQFLALLRRRHVIVHELDAARDFRASKFDEDATIAENLGKKNGPWRDFIFKMGTEGVNETLVEARLRAAFTEASGLQAGEPVTVPLPWGRSMDIAEAAGGVGRFSFSQLCGKAMNADDYLKLTDHFHTILVTDVPRFGVEKHNEARRFTNLVDCLYERHARLVVTADAPLEELLTGMEGLVEFDPNPIGSTKRSGPPPNLWSSQGSTQTPAMAAAADSSGGRGTGDDDTATGANIAGVMTGAVASLQESGFAARRAMSRLLHMQSEEYLRVHQRSRATL